MTFVSETPEKRVGSVAHLVFVAQPSLELVELDGAAAVSVKNLQDLLNVALGKEAQSRLTNVYSDVEEQLLQEGKVL